MKKAKINSGRCCGTCNVGVGTILSVAHNFQAPSLPVAESEEAGVMTVCLPVPMTVCVPIEYLDAQRRRCETQSVVPCRKRRTKDIPCGSVRSRPCLAGPCPQAPDTRSRCRYPSRKSSRQLLPPLPPCGTRTSQVCRTRASLECRTRTSQECRTSVDKPPTGRRKCESLVSNISERTSWPPETSVDLPRLVPQEKRRDQVPTPITTTSTTNTGKKKRESSDNKRRESSTTTVKKKREPVSSPEPPSATSDNKRRESSSTTVKKKRDSKTSEIPSPPKRRTSSQQKRKCERKPVKPGETIPEVPKCPKPRTKHPCLRRPVRKSKGESGQATGTVSNANDNKTVSPSQLEVAKAKEGSLDKDRKKNGGKKNGAKKGGGKGGGKGNKKKGKGKGKGKKSKKSADRENVLLVRCPPAIFNDSTPAVSVPCQPYTPYCR